MKKYTVECSVVYEIECEDKTNSKDIKEFIHSKKPFLAGSSWGNMGTINYKTKDDKFKINSITRRSTVTRPRTRTRKVRATLCNENQRR